VLRKLFPSSGHARLFFVTGLVFLSAGSILWWRSATVVLVADGKSQRLSPGEAKSVADLLTNQSITLLGNDFVTPSTSSALSRNLVVKVTRVTHRDEVVTKTLEPVVKGHLRTRSNLRPIWARRGFVTDVSERIRIYSYDGVEARREVVSRRNVRRPFYTLTLYNKQGFPVKEYDLLKSSSMATIATGYYVGDPMVPSDEVFLGYKLKRGMVAVDPKVIPLRSRLYIPGYGYGYACDTGSAIKKHRIDLAVKDRKEERRYMHRPMTVYILEEARRW
jgi:3D (Asp-Asp-Asp) domain-containing protein